MVERILKDYATLVFDCDGVLLDSNRVKTDAFYQAVCPTYGPQMAEAMVAYHVAHGGVSRYKKFDYFLREIAEEVSNDTLMAPLLEAYAAQVRQGLLTCGVAPGLEALRELTPSANWLVVSGGDQAELRQVFAARGLADLFDGGIFGSPDSKDTILARELASQTISQPAVFIGDSRYDHVASSTYGLDFLFVYDWSEFAEWRQYSQEHGIACYANLEALIEALCLCVASA